MRLGRFALVVGVLAVGCSYTCSCPSGGAAVALPDPTATVAEVRTDPSCFASESGHGEIYVSTEGSKCVVHLRLTDGQTYEATVLFGNDGACGCHLAKGVATFVPTDATD